MFGCPGARFAALMVLGAVVGCSGVSDNAIPPDVRDPTAVKTPAGAMAIYRGTLALFSQGINRFMVASGTLTDELVALAVPVGMTMGGYTPLDTRALPEGIDVALRDAGGSSVAIYGELHGLRNQAREGRGFLKDYAPDSSSALRGMLYAAEAYAEVYLADLFCSGIPLSTLDYGKDFTVRPGSSTALVYRDAIELFDSAYALSGDSVRFQWLAAVGRARAYLALGDYSAALASVADVPDDFIYGFTFTTVNRRGYLWLWMWDTPPSDGPNLGMTMADLEGHNGLDYRSSNDPRTPYDFRWVNSYGDSMMLPVKYRFATPAMLAVASGVEANLIRAEVALHNGSSAWLDMLNALRTDGTATVTPRVDDPEALDSMWNAGTGGVAGLAPLTDPGTDRARQDLLFRERAFWLYLTGMRQGDLRRLIRNYGRRPEELYPTGGQYKGATGIYGSDITVPVPPGEQYNNPYYTGCIHRNA